MDKFGFLRIGAASPQVHIGNPYENAKIIRSLIVDNDDCDILVFPELSITGYSCANLFQQRTLMSAAYDALFCIASAVPYHQLVMVGLPIMLGNSLYNCAAVIHDQKIIGVVPKQHIPTYKEFYEARWFKAATGLEEKEIVLDYEKVPFGIDLLFQRLHEDLNVIVGVEICEDLWVPVPPSSLQTVAGANVLINLSASNETIGKSDYRRNLVVGQSGRCMSAYAYACAGTSESTTDTVMAAHNIIAENGRLLVESEKLSWGRNVITRCDVDIQMLNQERREQMHDQKHLLPRKYRFVDFSLKWNNPECFGKAERPIDGMPFVPRKSNVLTERCRDINNICAIGLARRLSTMPDNTQVWFGVSGGADSTKVALDIRRAFNLLGRPLTLVNGVTMPGFGTHSSTKSNALDLIEGLGFTSHTWDIRPTCMDTFRSINYHPFGYTPNTNIPDFQNLLNQLPPDRRKDLVFENVQARVRTMFLMSRGFVVGTGDLTEAALGWCTYNGDHMSMYNPNCSIPKSLVCFLIRYAAETEFAEGPIRDTLLKIADTVISPELLPTLEGEIAQSTEDILGPFFLHDFIMYYNIRYGFAPRKIRYLARLAIDQGTFPTEVTPELLDKVFQIHYDRFLQQQFKRSASPDGPKVGSVSLSPRGDWRQPSDADNTLWRGAAQ
jgi:NAD+ synthase (glutamine-hydrolysing)